MLGYALRNMLLHRCLHIFLFSLLDADWSVHIEDSIHPEHFVSWLSFLIKATFRIYHSQTQFLLVECHMLHSNDFPELSHRLRFKVHLGIYAPHVDPRTERKPTHIEPTRTEWSVDSGLSGSSIPGYFLFEFQPTWFFDIARESSYHQSISDSIWFKHRILSWISPHEVICNHIH